jgi:DnaJ-class molecular chaperone
MLHQQLYLVKDMTILGKAICPDCNGNGFVGSAKQPDECRDCSKCKNQGEIVITEEEINKMLETVETARLQ